MSDDGSKMDWDEELATHLRDVLLPCMRDLTTFLDPEKRDELSGKERRSQLALLMFMVNTYTASVMEWLIRSAPTSSERHDHSVLAAVIANGYATLRRGCIDAEAAAEGEGRGEAERPATGPVELPKPVGAADLRARLARAFDIDLGEGEGK